MSAAVFMMCGWLIGACSPDGDRFTRTGGVSAQLTLPDGVQIDSVNHRVTRAGALVRMDDVDLRGSSSPSFRVGALPLGPGYHMDLRATAILRDVEPAQTVPCSGEMDFAIEDTLTTPFSILLSCGTPESSLDTSGDLRTDVNVVVAPPVSCPVITGVEALPMQGTSTELTGFTSSQTLIGSLVWTGLSGAFSNQVGASATFTCTQQGEVTVTFTLTPSDIRCRTQTYHIVLECTGAGELPLPTCPAGWWDHDDNPLTSCVEVAAHSVCPPLPQAGGLAAVDLHCEYGTECCCSACHPSIVCNAQAGQRLMCNYTDACFAPNCSNNSACRACMDQHCRGADTFGVDFVAGCFESVDQSESPVGDPVTFLRDCKALVGCASITGCGRNAAGGIWSCYCGSASYEECFETGPSPFAVCTPYWQQAMRTTDPHETEERITSLSYPSGWAYLLWDCAARHCADVCF